jgi:hypothetical protein
MAPCGGGRWDEVLCTTHRETIRIGRLTLTLADFAGGGLALGGGYLRDNPPTFETGTHPANKALSNPSRGGN